MHVKSNEAAKIGTNNSIILTLRLWESRGHDYNDNNLVTKFCIVYLGRKDHVLDQVLQYIIISTGIACDSPDQIFSVPK